MSEIVSSALAGFSIIKRSKNLPGKEYGWMLVNQEDLEILANGECDTIDEAENELLIAFGSLIIAARMR